MIKLKFVGGPLDDVEIGHGSAPDWIEFHREFGVIFGFWISDRVIDHRFAVDFTGREKDPDSSVPDPLFLHWSSGPVRRDDYPPPTRRYEPGLRLGDEIRYRWKSVGNGRK